MKKKKIKSKLCSCGKSFLPKTSLQKFCSPECFYKAPGKVAKEIYQQVKKIGKRLNKLRKENPKFIKNSRELRQKQVMQCGFTYCEMCHKPGIVEAHHIIYRSEKPGHSSLHSKRSEEAHV